MDFYKEAFLTPLKNILPLKLLRTTVLEWPFQERKSLGYNAQLLNRINKTNNNYICLIQEVYEKQNCCTGSHIEGNYVC